MPNGHNGHLRILVADDEDEIRTFLEKILLKAGHEVLLVMNGRTAIETLQSQPVDVALVDLMLGDLNGIEVLKFAKRNTPAVEIIMMSAYGTFGNVVELIRQGALDFIEKPFEVNFLLSRIEKAARVRELNLRFQFLDDQFNNIKQLKAFSENIVNNIPQGLIAVNSGDEAILVNGLLLRLMQEREETVLGRDIREFIRLKFDNSDRVIEMYDRVKNHGGNASMLLYNNTVGKEQRHFRLTVNAFPGGVMVLLNDITKEYNSRQKLIQNERMSMLGEFVSSVTHGLGNNMANIISNASGVADECRELDVRLADCESLFGRSFSRADGLEPEQVETHDCHHERIVAGRNRIADYSGRLLKRVYEMDENIKALLNFARIRPSKKIPTDVNTVVEEAVSVAKSSGTGEITFLKSLSKDLPSARIDPLQIKGLVIDLVMNAIQSIPGRGTIIYETGYDPAGRTVQIRISDTGAGIKPGDQPRIFDAFFTTKQSGTGLGLVNVKNIVRQHDGKVTFKTEEGKGTTFSVELPVDAAAEDGG